MSRYLFLKISVIVIIIAIAITSSFLDNYNTKGKIQKAFPIIYEDIQKINKISFEKKSDRFMLYKSPKSWVIENPENYPADIKKIKKFIYGLSSSSFINTTLTNKENFDKLGVSYPLNSHNESIRMKFYNNNQIIYDFIVGKTFNEASDYNIKYYRNVNQDQVFLFKNQLDFPTEKFSWINTELFKIARWRIKEVLVNEINSKNSFKIYRDNYSSQNFKFSKLPKNYELINNYSFNAFASVLEGAKIIDIISKPDNLDTIQYTKSKTIKISTFDGLHLNLQLFKFDKESYFKINTKSDKNIRQELSQDSDKIVGIPSMKSYDDVEEEVKKIEFSEKWLYKFDEASIEQLTKSKYDFIKKINK